MGCIKKIEAGAKQNMHVYFETSKLHSHKQILSPGEMGRGVLVHY